MKGAEKRMQLLNNYFIMEDAVPERYCDYILQYGQKLKEQEAKIGWSGNLPKEEVEKIRHSKIVWLDERWIYREIEPLVREANIQAGWNFEWSTTESFQFTKYEGSKKQHYDWHADSKPQDFGNRLIRKISASLILVDKENYEGGDFQINIPSSPDKTQIVNVTLLKKGTMIFFPSFVYHRVTPVTKGTRYSLVSWSKGKDFI
jgi:PKHD-type hydroxylase